MTETQFKFIKAILITIIVATIFYFVTLAFPYEASI